MFTMTGVVVATNIRQLYCCCYFIIELLRYEIFQRGILAHWTSLVVISLVHSRTIGQTQYMINYEAVTTLIVSLTIEPNEQYGEGIISCRMTSGLLFLFSIL